MLTMSSYMLNCNQQKKPARKKLSKLKTLAQITGKNNKTSAFKKDQLVVNHINKTTD